MRPILPPPPLCRVVNQRANHPMRSLATLRIFSIKHNAHDMMHLAHPYDKSADEVEASFLAALAREFVLAHRIWARDFGDGTEKEVRAVGQPVNLYQVSSRLHFSFGKSI